MPQLIEPDGTPNIKIMDVEAVIKWCEEHPGWSWRYTEDDP